MLVLVRSDLFSVGSTIGSDRIATQGARGAYRSLSRVPQIVPVVLDTRRRGRAVAIGAPVQHLAAVVGPSDTRDPVPGAKMAVWVVEWRRGNAAGGPPGGHGLFRFLLRWSWGLIWLAATGRDHRQVSQTAVGRAGSHCTGSVVASRNEYGHGASATAWRCSLPDVGTPACWSANYGLTLTAS